VEHADTLPLPVRWQYCGPVFRSVAGARELTQLGGELIGASSLRADAEVLAVAWRGIERLELQNAQMHVGSAGLLAGLLNSLGVSERAQGVILAHMDALRDGSAGIVTVREQLSEFGLLGGVEQGGMLAGMEEEDARSLIRGLLSSGNPNAIAPGGREPDEILQRFLAKRAAVDDPQLLERALRLGAELAAIRDDPDEAFSAGEEVITGFGLSPNALSDLRRLVQLLGEQEVEPRYLTVDLGLARGLTYYTGITFDLVHPDLPGDGLLGGGGRYDGLVRALGGDRDIPAMGFAYYLESLEAALNAEGQDGPSAGDSGADVLLLPGGRSGYRVAVQSAAALREAGFRVAVDTEERPLMAARRYAEESGIRWVVVLSDGGEVLEEYAAARLDRFASPRSPRSVLGDAPRFN
ncbi:MAG: ATP phosphoribosyltransferase regulatory subunit, partial [Chloroflexi bacterium]|nr:ATP phosphoribosyltransferase regulatory subunit [Chloroflexota bacterium]